MKKVFIPQGELVCHTFLYTDRLIVKGTLRVSGKLVAKEILGGGVIEAREIICDSIQADCVTADFITAEKIAVKKMFVQFECRASNCIAAANYITAGYVSTGKLSMTLSDIQSCDADEIITLPLKGRGLLGLLWVSWWRGLFLSMFHHGVKKQDKKQETEQNPPADTPVEKPAVRQDDDMTKMLISILGSLQENGYRVSKADAPDADSKRMAA